MICLRVLLALSIAIAPAWAAHDFNGSTDKALSTATPEVTAMPLTLCCWGKSDSATAGQNAFELIDRADASFNDTWSLNWQGSVAGDPIRAQTAASGGPASAAADSGTGYSTGTWHHGCARFTSSTSRDAAIDGAFGPADSASVSPTGVSGTSIGIANREGGTPANFFDGSIAECGLWNVALSNADVAALAKGFAPPCVRRAALVGYYPMIRDATTLKDYFTTSTTLTLTGTTVADHPRILYCR